MLLPFVVELGHVMTSFKAVIFSLAENDKMLFYIILYIKFNC